MEKNNDYSNGNHSFKSWFKLMWGETYIQLFLLAIAFIIGILCYAGLNIILVIPVLSASVIGYKGFYQRWQDYIHGRSR